VTEEPGESEVRDVRMKGFAERADVEEVEAFLEAHAHALAPEPVPLLECVGRVLATEIEAGVDVPGFRRSAMDGYAVRGEETFGASAYDPIALEIVGLSLPGAPFAGPVERGQAVRIMTGAPVPDETDAVVMAEVCEERDGRVEIVEPVAPTKNVGVVGEDIRVGEVVLHVGRRLRPQDAGLLSSIGVSQVPSVRRPRVRLVVTGDELLEAGARPSGAHIVDSNSVVLRALVARDGGECLPFEILPDVPERIRDALAPSHAQGDTDAQDDSHAQGDTDAQDDSHAQGDTDAQDDSHAQGDADVVLVSGGSSVGQEDHAPRLLAELGSLDFHGISMRPSSPTGLGRIGDAFVFLLPGNPVSCLAAYEFFAGPTLRALGGRSRRWPHPKLALPLGRKIVSAIGRTDYVRVAVEGGRAIPIATSGASILSSTVRAAGAVVVPRELEGMPEGAVVEVLAYDDDPDVDPRAAEPT